MRRADDILHVQQGMIQRRLALIDVNSGVSWSPGSERGYQRGAAGIHKEGRRLHLRQVYGSYDAACLLHQLEMQTQHIRLLKKRILTGCWLKTIDPRLFQRVLSSPD